MREDIKNSSGEERQEVFADTIIPREEPAFTGETITATTAHNEESRPMAEPQHTVPTASGETPGNTLPPGDGTSGKTVAGLILGISSVALSFTVMLSAFGLAAGIVGLIFAIQERKVHPSGMATASFILSLIGLIAGALSTVACVACMGFYGWLGYWGAFDDPGVFDMYDVMDL